MIIKYIYRKSEQPSYGWYHPCFLCYIYTSQYIILNKIENVFNIHNYNLHNTTPSNKTISPNDNTILSYINNTNSQNDITHSQNIQPCNQYNTTYKVYDFINDELSISNFSSSSSFTLLSNSSNDSITSFESLYLTPKTFSIDDSDISNSKFINNNNIIN